MLLIKNGRVVDPVNGVDKVMDVLVDGGQIVMTGDKAVDMFDEAKASAGIGEAGNIVCGSDVNYEEHAFNVIDAAGLVVAPGLVDTHVHFRDPGLTYKGDIFTGAAAAAKGGFTTVVCMANTKPTVDNVDTLAYVLEKGAQTGIHVLSAAAVTKGLGGTELVDMEALAKAGAAGFTDDGIPIMDEKILVQAMEKAKELLCNSNMKVAQVSEQVGIPNVSYFCRSFREYYGSSPESYRKGTGEEDENTGSHKE